MITRLNFSKIAFAFAFMFLCLPGNLLHAETVISNGYLSEGAAWTKAGSPYILLDDVFISQGHSLYIGPGVEIRTASSSREKRGISVFGDIRIDGRAGDPVLLDFLSGISINGGTSTISFAQFTNFSRALHVNYGFASVKNSTFKGGSIAIGLRKAVAVITDSYFENIYEAIHIFSSGGIFQVRIDTPILGTGGEGNLLEDFETATSTTISNNSFSGSNGVVWGVRNDNNSIVDAKNNWWGNKDGPGTIGAARASFSVLTSPWLEMNPQDKEKCCSSILFIPGIEGSRLQVDEKVLLGTSTNMLWEPNRNDDVRKLYLDETGKSILPDIYTTGIIDSAFGHKIYMNFIHTMNKLVADKVVNSWKALAYDWRKPIDTVANDDFVQEVIKSAGSSMTGKVSVIAHSNGGLVTKLLVKKLEEKGLANLIDKIILVAVPELGTPQTIAALLHGDGQRLLGGIILQAKVAQKLAQNMPSAYSSLPTLEYFKRISDPVVYAGSSRIDSSDGFRQFMSTAAANTNLFDIAHTLRGIFDAWRFPASINVVSMAETGIPTAKALSYKTATSTADYKIIKSNSGDGTVILPSATLSGKAKYIFDGGLIDVSHANILQSAAVISAIKKEIAPDIAHESFERHLVNDPYKYDGVAYRSIGVHSPIELHAYDADGGHTGRIPNPDPDSDLDLFEDHAKGVRFDIMNGDDYLVFDRATSSATILLKGTGIGSFTLDDEIVIGTSSYSTIFPKLPVTPLFQARFEMDMSSPTSTGGIVYMDFDGDGNSDGVATSGSVFDLDLHLQALRKTILSLELSFSVEKKMLKRIDSITEGVSRGRIKYAAKTLTTFESLLSGKHWLRNKISPNDRQVLVDSIEAILSAIERAN